MGPPPAADERLAGHAHDLVVVLRGIDGGTALNDFIGKVLAAITPREAAKAN